MFKRKSYYELDVCGVEFWNKTIDDRGNYVYIKDRVNKEYTLYLDKYGKDKYMDLVTGRPFTIYEDNDYLVILPSGIKVYKESLRKGNGIISKTASILDNKEDEERYTNISEGIIYDSYFCNMISFKYGLNVIPDVFVYDEINSAKKKYDEEIKGNSRKLVR